MAESKKRITDYPEATEFSSNHYLLMDDGEVTKKIKASNVGGGITVDTEEPTSSIEGSFYVQIDEEEAPLLLEDAVVDYGVNFLRTDIIASNYNRIRVVLDRYNPNTQEIDAHCDNTFNISDISASGYALTDVNRNQIAFVDVAGGKLEIDKIATTYKFVFSIYAVDPIPVETNGIKNIYAKYNGEWEKDNFSSGGTTAINLTQAQYDALSQEEKADATKIYFVDEVVDFVALPFDDFGDSKDQGGNSCGASSNNVITCDFDDEDYSWSVSMAGKVSIDLTNISELKLITDATFTDYARARVYISQTDYSVPQVAQWYSLLESAETNVAEVTASGTTTIDTSSYSGSYYVYVTTFTGLGANQQGTCDNTKNGSIVGTLTLMNKQPAVETHRIYYKDNLYTSQGDGSNGYKRTVLYNTVITSPQQITLLDDITNYDQLEIVAEFDNAHNVWRMDVDYFMDTFPYMASPDYTTAKHWLLSTYSGSYIRVIMGDANNKIYPFDFSNGTIRCISGIKYTKTAS